MKRFVLNAKWIAVMLVVLLASCATGEKKKYDIVTATVKSVSVNGDLVLDVSATKFAESGFEYGDMVSVRVGGFPSIVMPYVSSYSDAGVLGMHVRNNRDGSVIVSIADACFSKWIGGKQNSRVVIAMSEKDGFSAEFNLINVEQSDERTEYYTDEEFANFREVKLPAAGNVYRSCHPLDCVCSPSRYSYASKLAEETKIETMICLSGLDDDVKTQFDGEDYDADYGKKAYREGKVMLSGMAADFFDSGNLRKLNGSFKFMLSHEAPYLVSCDDGKDLTGMFVALLQAVAGCTIDDIRQEYMASFVNINGVNRRSRKYKEIEKRTIDRFLYFVANPDKVEQLAVFDWEKMSLDGIDLQQAAESYLHDLVGLSDEEIGRLKEIAKGGSAESEVASAK